MFAYACGQSFGAADSAGAADAQPSGAGALGAPCITSSECTSGVCTPIGPDDAGTVRSVCTTVCGSQQDCVAGWSCVPVAGESKSICSCTASAETCNGKDDDCNGRVDDDPPASAACKQLKGEATWSCKAADCACTKTLCGRTTSVPDGGPTPPPTAMTCTDLSSDSANCGACGNRCATGAQCVAGGCTCGGAPCGVAAGAVSAECGGSVCRSQYVVAAKASAFALSTTDIFHVSDGTVTRTPKEPIGSTPVVVLNQNAVYKAIAADDTNVYLDYSSGGNDTVAYCAKAGCSAPTPIALSGGHGATSGTHRIDVVGNVVYWVVLGVPYGATLWSAATSSGTGAVVATFPLDCIVSGGGYDVDGARAFVAGLTDQDPTSSALMEALLDGGTPTTVATNVGTHAVASDPTFIYYEARANDGGASPMLMRCGQPNCSSPSPIAPLVGQLGAIAVDAKTIFFADKANIRSCPAAGCGQPAPTPS
jgi:hypothetical protein